MGVAKVLYLMVKFLVAHGKGPGPYPRILNTTIGGFGLRFGGSLLFGCLELFLGRDHRVVYTPEHPDTRIQSRPQTKYGEYKGNNVEQRRSPARTPL